MEENKLPLRDQLAQDRTLLANERTLLAYLRTFIGLVASGAALWKLFEVGWAQGIAAVFFICAPIVLVVGFTRYNRMNKRMVRITGHKEDE